MEKHCNCNCDSCKSCKSTKDELKTRQEIKFKVAKIQESIRKCLKLITPKKEEKKEYEEI